MLLCVIFQLSDAGVEILQLRGRCKEQLDCIEQLKAELEDNVDEFSILSYQSKTVICCQPWLSDCSWFFSTFSLSTLLQLILYML